jgi:hypothetical protein
MLYQALTHISQWIGLLGKIYRKTPYLMGNSMVSSRFSLKPIHWISHVIWMNHDDFIFRLVNYCHSASCHAAVLKGLPRPNHKSTQNQRMWSQSKLSTRGRGFSVYRSSHGKCFDSVHPWPYHPLCFCLNFMNLPCLFLQIPMFLG